MAGDPRSYFLLEARELVEGLTQGALHAERHALSGDQRRHLLRLAHTLKGAARVVKEPVIADSAHAIEDLIAEAGDGPDAALASRLLALLDRITRALPDPPPLAAAPEAKPGTADDASRTVRVELGVIDGLLERVAEVGARCAALRDELAMLPGRPAAAQRAFDSLEGVSAEVAQLRADVRQMRLAPAHTLFLALERAVRDAAQSAGVHVRFEASGGDHRLDADVLAAVRDALIQIARNAAAHGIEPAGVRASAGKPAEGTFTLAVERRGGDVAFICRDDGRGLDLQALRGAAVASGLVDEARAAALPEPELIRVLLEGGLSTRRSVSQLAGRGVGLDLVRAVATRLNGRVELDNRPGHGITIALVVPVSLRSLPCLALESAGRLALLPLDAVQRTVRLSALPQVHADGRRHLVIDDAPVPYLSLDSVFARGEAGARASERVAAIVAIDEERVAVGAAALGEVSTLVVQALPPLARAAAVVRGIAVDDRGFVVPVLEPAELLTMVRAEAPAAETASRRTPRLLVVDDSITTRMLEQSILESAGFEVDTAASAEEALTRAAAMPYDAFIVDVEMPGMNGFEFVAQTRADPALQEIPAILVTSRAAAADRQRGVAAGASAYIVKSDFDQDVFLETIRGLVG